MTSTTHTYTFIPWHIQLAAITCSGSCRKRNLSKSVWTSHEFSVIVCHLMAKVCSMSSSTTNAFVFGFFHSVFRTRLCHQGESNWAVESRMSHPSISAQILSSISSADHPLVAPWPIFMYGQQNQWWNYMKPAFMKLFPAVKGCVLSLGFCGIDSRRVNWITSGAKSYLTWFTSKSEFLTRSLACWRLWSRVWDPLIMELSD